MIDENKSNLLIKPQIGYWKGGKFEFEINKNENENNVICKTPIFHPEIRMNGEVLCKNVLKFKV